MSEHPTTGFTPFYLMYERQPQLPVDLLYGSPEPEAVSPSQYVAKLKASISEAYKKCGRIDIPAAKVSVRPLQSESARSAL